jgi:hypothetical protein
MPAMHLPFALQPLKQGKSVSQSPPESTPFNAQISRSVAFGTAVAQEGPEKWRGQSHLST